MLCFCDVTLRDFDIHLNVYSLQYNRIELSKPRMGPMQAIHRRRWVTSRPYVTWRYSPCAVLKRRWCLLLAACSMHAHCTIPFLSFPFLLLLLDYGGEWLLASFARNNSLFGWQNAPAIAIAIAKLPARSLAPPQGRMQCNAMNRIQL